MDDKACDVLSEVDNLFTRGIVNVGKFNKLTKYHSYCPYQNGSKENKCTNDYERFNALGSYLFTKISEIDENYKKKKGVSQHIELFMIWLGGKLFKMDNDYKATLEESYKKHLEKYMGNVKYWEAIDSKKLYKNATIRKMDELYRLIDNVCKLITEYNKNTQKPDRKSLGNHAVQCRNFYKAIHKSINGCRPYLHLLDNVKMMYENFRWYQIVDNNNLNGTNKGLLLKNIQPLTTFNNENQLFVTVAANLSFDDKECKEAKSNDEKIGEQIASKKSKNPVRVSQTRVSGNKKRGNPGSSHPKQPPAQPKTLKSPHGQLNSTPPAPAKPAPSQTDNELKTPQAGKPHQNGLGDTVNGAGGGKGNAGSGVNGGGSVQGDKGSKSGASDGGLGSSSKTQASSDTGTGSLGGEPGGTAGGKGGSDNNLGVKNSGSGVSGGGTSSGQDGGKVGSNGGASGGKGDAGKGVNVGDSAQGDQGKSSNKTDSGAGSHADKGSQGGSGNQTQPSENSSPASSGAGTPQSSGMTTPGTSSVSPPSPSTPQVPATLPQQSDPQQPGSPTGPPPADPPVPPQQKPGQPPQTGGSSNPNESKDLGNSKGNTGGTNDNKGDPNSGNGNPGGGSSGPTSGTSGGSFDWSSSIFEFILKGKEYYNKASEFIEHNHQKFKDAAEKISGAYNDTVENLKSAYNASSDYLNKFINNVTSQLNQVGSPSGGGNSSNQSPSPQLPSTTDPSNPPTSSKNTSSDPASNQQPNSPSTPSKDPLPTTPTDPSKASLQQNQSPPQSQTITQHPAQVKQTNHQKIGQFIKSLSSDLILKKPWNIFPTTWNGSGDCKPEIKFMNTTLICCTSEQCSLTGIPVILVLIPIILLIAYKYLSFGSSQKSEKKNMNRVINFHDGNRKTKIIISSNDRSKHLKPVINLVGGKKKSLLNIYKLIRADPMPFINLFFLLIFFVYKRKRDTIE
ncbi:PIR protein CIR protein [Plasmodium vinckei]|uniref:PIR protein CIR protein n=1 Tax=Plasmodium vinckei TaxID=5860 RepID=A0A6V7SFH9_PLAVN|nr:PIR protein CIR protein [Plasmodium vinckei]